MFKIRRVESAVPAINVRKEVQTIHDEFDIASDKILEAANKIVNPVNKELEEMADKLKKAGFFSSRLLLDVQKSKSAVELTLYKAEIVKKYSQKYPNYKFIFEEQITEICEKYGLIFGSVSNYTGDVPKKNLDEISNFKVNDEDVYFVIRSAHASEKIIPSSEVARYNTSDFYTHVTKIPFKICAPRSDMKLKPNQTVEGVFIKEVPDPIVLHYVLDGYLIVTKWGLEASDPLTINEKHN